MDADRSVRAVRAARELARAASLLAAEAAALARVYSDHGPSEDAALTASEASIHATRAALDLDDRIAAGESAVDAAIRASLASLEAASAAVAATRAALDAALSVGRDGAPMGAT